MCLAVPGKVVSREGDELIVDFQGTQSQVGGMMTPDVGAGDWVLVHAGYAISQLDEAEAKKTWSYLEEIQEIREQEDRAHADVDG